MTYYETRNPFARSKFMFYQFSGFPPEQYTFPFSFKTLEGWPASYNYISVHHYTYFAEKLMQTLFKL